MKEKLPSHDDFVRSILSNKETATDFFKSYLPGNFVESLDFSHLDQSGETYLSDELKKSIPDIANSCKLEDGKTAAT